MTLSYMKVMVSILVGLFGIGLCRCGVKGEPAPYVETEQRSEGTPSPDKKAIKKDK